MRRYNFDRPGRAQGIGVHANSLAEAETKAQQIQVEALRKGEFNKDCELIFRDNRPCLPSGRCSICYGGHQ
jgi:hypothetical protein